MPTAITVHDPRLPALSERMELTPRLDSLHRREVLLFDNGKLAPAFGGYGAVFDALEGELRKRGARIRGEVADLLALTGSQLERLADDVAARAPDAVVLAVCDTGVSMPTTVFATELERRGIPASLVAYGIGAQVARATLARVLPGVPVLELNCDRTVPYDGVAREMADGVSDRVVDSLLATPAELVRRFEASGVPAAVDLRPDATIELRADDPTLTFTDMMRLSGLGDGFPLIPPAFARVDAMLHAMRADPGDEVWSPVIPRMQPVTARDVAVVAVMAGCPVATGPLVLAAFRAMNADEFRLFQAAITTHPAGTLVLVSGPGSSRMGVEAGPGSLGPGHPVNAAVGRAVAMSYNALLGLRPGGGDLTVLGSPAEFSYCVAEALDASPWPGHNADVADESDTVVTVVKCEGPQNVLDNVSTTANELLDCIAANLHGVGRNNSYVPRAQTIVFLNPEHAKIVAGTGWTKQDVQHYLYDVARSDRDDLAGGGITPIWPAWFRGLDRIPIVARPEDLLVVVTGGHGPQSAVALPWGYSRGVTVTLGG